MRSCVLSRGCRGSEAQKHRSTAGAEVLRTGHDCYRLLLAGCRLQVEVEVGLDSGFTSETR